jgi:DNA adenine methylase
LQAKPSQQDSETLRPPLKWAGGKRWLLPHLRPIWEKHRQRRYVEPFCGGLAIAIGLKPREGFMNDVNPHLINFYNQIRSGLRVAIKTENSEKSFYLKRDRFNQLIRQSKAATAEAAQLFYYLNRTGYNGLCRFNRSGGFNVPFGRYSTVNYRRNFESYESLFRTWSFIAGDLESVQLDPDDFVYADPPYDVQFTSYSAGGFSWDDQIRTAHWLADHKGPVVLSNQATPRIVRLYKGLGFKLRYFEAPRRISCNGDRASAREVLATKAI